MTTYNKISGAILNAALGDAWGYVTEFWSYDRILDELPEVPELLKVSDDTQMAIYTMNATLAIVRDLQKSDSNILEDKNIQDYARLVYVEEHLKFAHDPDNNRAPGMTCMSALSVLENGTPITGLEGSETNDSKGCGTIMRAPWIGLVNELTEEEIFALAVIQSQTTHGNPISWLVSGVAAVITRRMSKLEQVEDFDISSPYIVLQAKEIAVFFLETWLNFGEYEYVSALIANLDNILSRWDEFLQFEGDHCEFFGQGWTADEALFTSIATASKFINEPFSAIQALVYTKGDSDSLATLAGSFLGALHGIGDSYIEEINNRLEPRYKDELNTLIHEISQINHP